MAGGPGPSTDLDVEAQVEPPTDDEADQNETDWVADRGCGLFPFKRKYPDATCLGRGGFGEAWKVYDIVMGWVVLKLFYRYSSEARDGILYLTRDNLRATDQKKIAEAGRECDLANAIIDGAAHDDPGRNRFVRCLEKHVDNADPTDPLYLVHEYCGEDLQSYLRCKDNTPIRGSSKWRFSCSWNRHMYQCGSTCCCTVGHELDHTT